ncbi:MAG: LuxR family transcriptional regulator [Pseudomonadota bacterium]
MRLSDYVEQVSQADSSDTVFALLRAAADDLGFDRHAYCALTRRGYFRAAANTSPALAHSFPESWSERYVELGYVHSDPVIQHAAELDNPFLWDSLGSSFALDKLQTRLLREAEDSGLNNGVGIPLHGARGSLSLMSFASSSRHPNPTPVLPHLHVVASQFHAAYTDLVRSPAVSTGIALSPRERECLQWTACGKTAWEVGMLMRISENTVKFHLRNAMKKLDATTSIQAVVKAINHGLIRLDSRLGLG